MPQPSVVSQAMAEIPDFAQRYEILKKFNRVQGNDESTFERYAHQLAKFCIYFKKYPDEVSYEEYLEYYDKLLENNPSGGTMKLAVYGVRMYFYSKGLEPPKYAVPHIKEPKRVATYLTEDDVLVLIYSGETRMDKVSLGGLYSWGLRAEELVNVQLKDIHFDSHMLDVRQGKGKKDRSIPTPRLFENVLKDYIQKAKPQTYLIEKAPGEPVSVNYLRWRLSKTVIKSGIRKRIYLHLFRSTYAIHCILNGMNIYTLSRYMGHSSIVTTAQYLKALPDYIFDNVTLPFDKVFSKVNRDRLSVIHYGLHIH